MWREMWKSVLRYKGSVGIAVGKWVGMWGKMWVSVRGERGEVCLGVGGGEGRCGKRHGGCGGR